MVRSSAQKTLKSSLPLAETLKIGVVARQLGISASMIRAWEKLGLARPLRTNSSYRLYTSEDVRVLKRAVYLRKVLGLNVAAIISQLKQEGLLSRNRPASVGSGLAIGPRLRKIRVKRGESLADVASAVGISVGFISSLERAQVSASIGIMHKLAQHYGLNLLDFFNTVEAATPLVKSKDRKLLPGGPGVEMELLAWGKIIMEPHMFRVAPQAGSPDFYSHQGEEFLYVISGELVIHLQEAPYHLVAGDSFYFESSTPHRWINPGKVETILLWINTPPTF
ncbi:MAG: cupin domain-containing protein [Candidatus Acidiferrales bacterium]